MISQNLQFLANQVAYSTHLVEKNLTKTTWISNFKHRKTKKIPKSFEEQINAGKLNFIFFRSGQKFDMLGMDNYYGSTFYMVNNGDKKWAPFNELAESPAYKTDPLSIQWFCLSCKYASVAMDDYRKCIFDNHRKCLNLIESELPNLLPQNNASQGLRISTVAPGMDAAFIDIKILNDHPEKTAALIEKIYYEEFLKENELAYSRGSFGFIAPNCNLIASNDDGRPRNVRFNLGLDSKSVEILMKVLKRVSIETS